MPNNYPITEKTLYVVTGSNVIRTGLLEFYDPLSVSDISGSILSGLNRKTCNRSCANKHRTGIKYKINRPKDKVIPQRALKIRLLKNRGKIWRALFRKKLVK